MSDNGIELTFVTALDLYSEWQGTVIAKKYDSYGNMIDEYVADTVITAPDDDHTQWTARYELSYVDGAPYLMHEPGMFTGFALGTSIQDHQTNFGAPPPLDLETWQFGASDTEQQYFQTYPDQWQFQTAQERLEYQQSQSGGGGGRGIQPIQPTARLGGTMIYRPASFGPETARGGAFFRPATFQVRSDRSASREEMRQFCGNASGCGPSVGQVMASAPRFRSWASNTGIDCGAAGGGCAIASALFAETTWAPCFVATCSAAAIANAARSIFR